MLWVALGVLGAVWLYRLWRPARDRNRARTLYTSVIPVVFVSFAIACVLPARTSPLPGVVFWSGVSVAVLLLVAGAVHKHRDRVADERRRAALNLAGRKRMFSPAQVLAVWCAGGVVAVFAFLAVAATIAAAMTDGPVSRDASLMVGVITLVFAVVLAMCAWLHIALRHVKIAQEDERLRRLDLGIENDPQADDAV